MDFSIVFLLVPPKGELSGLDDRFEDSPEGFNVFDRPIPYGLRVLVPNLYKKWNK